MAWSKQCETHVQTTTVSRIGVESNLQQRTTNQNEAMTGCAFYSMPGRTPSKNCRPPCNALCPLSPCVSNSDWVVRRCKNAVCCCPLWCYALLAKAVWGPRALPSPDSRRATHASAGAELGAQSTPEGRCKTQEYSRANASCAGAELGAQSTPVMMQSPRVLLS